MEEPLARPEVPQATFKKRVAKSKSNFRKRAATPPTSESDSGSTSSEDEQGRTIKRRRKIAGVTATSTATAPTQQSSNEQSTTPLIVPLPTASDNATKASNWYDEQADGDLNAKNLLGTARTKTTVPPESVVTYKGAANYQSFIQKNPNSLSKQVGPVKASTNVRTITVTDFAPDVCKDYKTNREDYKHGWELDRDWEIGTKGKKVVGKTVASANRSGQVGDEEEEDDALLESIPFACIICKNPYTNPITTECGHYFCESCALQRYRKNPSCAACGSGTGGVFNRAKKLTRLLEKKRERAKKRKEKAIENGGEFSEAEGDGED